MVINLKNISVTGRKIAKDGARDKFQVHCHIPYRTNPKGFPFPRPRADLLIKDAGTWQVMHAVD